mmetsp:Transcript_32818/g.61023  ORF Transcript_32818/g.61023 Transcript_32818/m.61023 type:complete len:219 (+) Transcript_32818:394-1050(+)
MGSGKGREIRRRNARPDKNVHAAGPPQTPTNLERDAAHAVTRDPWQPQRRAGRFRVVCLMSWISAPRARVCFSLILYSHINPSSRHRNLRRKKKKKLYKKTTSDVQSTIVAVSFFQHDTHKKQVVVDEGSADARVTPEHAWPLEWHRGENVDGGSDEWRKGDRVYARWRSRSAYYRGRIRRVHGNGTFEVRFDDGDVQEIVHYYDMSRARPVDESWDR